MDDNPLLNHTGKGGRIASLRVVSNRHDQKTYEGGNNFSLYSTFKGTKSKKAKKRKNYATKDLQLYTHTYIQPPFGGTRVAKVFFYKAKSDSFESLLYIQVAYGFLNV